jgi:hypothetical protein
MQQIAPAKRHVLPCDVTLARIGGPMHVMWPERTEPIKGTAPPNEFVLWRADH